jgi:hypothetical protein
MHMDISSCTWVSRVTTEWRARAVEENANKKWVCQHCLWDRSDVHPRGMGGVLPWWGVGMVSKRVAWSDLKEASKDTTATDGEVRDVRKAALPKIKSMTDNCSWAHHLVMDPRGIRERKEWFVHQPSREMCHGDTKMPCGDHVGE